MADVPALLSRRSWIGALVFAPEAAAAPRTITFGVITDVHQDIMHDAPKRLDAFVQAARRRKADFIVELGDFCRPAPSNAAFLKVWESFGGPRRHVLGNHEIDGGYQWEDVRRFYGMERNYYSFDQGGWHFVALDANERGEGDARKGYPAYVGSRQMEWLERDLAEARGPAVVFSHQPLGDDEAGIENRAEVRALLERSGKVIAAVNGHLHLDHATVINGIHYLEINSASYQWMGERYAHTRYGEAIEKEHPAIRFTAPYADPLYAFVTLSPKGWIQVEGRKSRFVGPSPRELGSPKSIRSSARISNRLLRFRRDLR
jgi:calcineurin-like phosphoesterase family protein